MARHPCEKAPKRDPILESYLYVFLMASVEAELLVTPDLLYRVLEFSCHGI